MICDIHVWDNHETGYSTEGYAEDPAYFVMSKNKELIEKHLLENIEVAIETCIRTGISYKDVYSKAVSNVNKTMKY